MSMSAVLQELVALLSLEKIEEDLYRGQSQDPGWGTVYGGQVIGQALFAALATVPAERPVHSLHAYFLRPGDVGKPIVYQVERTRDGGSFSARRVSAIQSGQPIFDMSASFHAVETGLSHASPMPDVPAPEQCPTEPERYARQLEGFPAAFRDRVLAERPIEWRLVDEPDVFGRTPAAPVRHVWFRAPARLPDTVALHQAMLAYASDFAFLTTALRPHGQSWLSGDMRVASVDHSIWFHAPFRADEWLLHAMESPWAGGARGLAHGRIYTREGTLVASTAQEGLIRKR